MVNITYDACESQPSSPVACAAPHSPRPAGSIEWFDPDTDGGFTWVYNPGDIAWILASMALVWIMIPGVGFFYSGLLRRKNAMSQIYLSMVTLAVVSFQVRLIFVFHVGIIMYILWGL